MFQPDVKQRKKKMPHPTPHDRKRTLTTVTESPWHENESLFATSLSYIYVPFR